MKKFLLSLLLFPSLVLAQSSTSPNFIWKLDGSEVTFTDSNWTLDPNIGGGGGGTPGGSDTQFQFNDDGDFGGTASLTLDSNDNLVLGANILNSSVTPLGIIDLYGESDADSRMILRGFDDDDSVYGHFIAGRAAGSIASPTTPLDGETLGQFSTLGYTGEAGFPWSLGAGMLGFANEDWSVSNRGSNLLLTAVPNGETDVQPVIGAQATPDAQGFLLVESGSTTLPVSISALATSDPMIYIKDKALVDTLFYAAAVETAYSSEIELNWNDSNIQRILLEGDITDLDFTASSEDMPAADFTLLLEQDGTGSRTVTNWDSSINWGLGSAPTLQTDPNRIDVIKFIWNENTSDFTGWHANAEASSTTSPAGNNGSIQFNNLGAFGASDDLVFGSGVLQLQGAGDSSGWQTFVIRDSNSNDINIFRADGSLQLTKMTNHGFDENQFINVQADFGYDGDFLTRTASNSTSEFSRLEIGKARGSWSGSLSALQQDDTFGYFDMTAYDGAQWATQIRMYAEALDDFSDGSTGSDLILETTPEGAAGSRRAMRLGMSPNADLFLNVQGGADGEEVEFDIESISGSGDGIFKFSKGVEMNEALYFGEVIDVTYASTMDIDWTAGNLQRIVLTGTGSTINFDANIEDYPAAELTLELIQDGTGNRVVSNWDSKINWATGQPTLHFGANEITVLKFFWDEANDEYVGVSVNEPQVEWPSSFGEVIYSNTSLPATSSNFTFDGTDTLGVPNVEITGGILAHSAITNNSSISNVVTIDWGVGNIQDLVLDENITTLNFTDPPTKFEGSELTLIVKQDGTGGHTVAGWDSDVLFPAGDDPVFTATANAVDIVKCVYDYNSGSPDYFCQLAGQAYQ